MSYVIVSLASVIMFIAIGIASVVSLGPVPFTVARKTIAMEIADTLNRTAAGLLSYSAQNEVVITPSFDLDQLVPSFTSEIDANPTGGDVMRLLDQGGSRTSGTAKYLVMPFVDGSGAEQHYSDVCGFIAGMNGGQPSVVTVNSLDGLGRVSGSAMSCVQLGTTWGGYSPGTYIAFVRLA